MVSGMALGGKYVPEEAKPCEIDFSKIEKKIIGQDTSNPNLTFGEYISKMSFNPPLERPRELYESLKKSINFNLHFKKIGEKFNEFSEEDEAKFREINLPRDQAMRLIYRHYLTGIII
jgi:hypothetical protein